MARYSSFFSANKKIILSIYDFECCLCQLVSYSNHVHHIDGNNRNDAFCNLAPLCDECHKMVHKSRSLLKINPSPGQLARLKLLYELYYLVNK